MTMHQGVRQVLTLTAVLFLWVAALVLADLWPWNPDPGALAVGGVGFYFLSRWP